VYPEVKGKGNQVKMEEIEEVSASSLFSKNKQKGSILFANRE